MNRRSELLLIIRREIERRKKLSKVSPFEGLLSYIRSLGFREGGSFICPGCGDKGKLDDMKDLSFHAVNKTIDTKVCFSCYIDLYGGHQNRIVESYYDFDSQA